MSTALATTTAAQVPNPTAEDNGPRWLSRDSDGDTVSNIVEVWYERPTRYNLPGGGAMWLGPGDTGVESREMSCTIAYAETKYRTLPDDDRMLVCIGVRPEDNK